jgi:pyruvate kinase
MDVPDMLQDHHSAIGTHYRRPKIVATLGPACRSPETLRAMLEAGVDVVRLNLSHGRHEEHAQLAQQARWLADALGRPLAILLDLQGPKIRTGELLDGKPVLLLNGSPIAITTQPVVGTAELVSTTYTDLPRDVRVGYRLLLDDGLLELVVRSVDGATVHCEVVQGGWLGEHKGINLPGVALSTPALTDKDAADLRFGLGIGVDYVALSFVREATDVLPVRECMRVVGRHVPVIAKLEKPEALQHLDAILSAFDGVMVARGDLGVELAPELVPGLQKHIIQRARQHGKVVITATQMLESMTTQPRPTRAETSDVANAICDGTDAVMLSGETAAGKFPVETVAVMDRIARQAQGLQLAGVHDHVQRSQAHAVALAACTLAQEIRVCAIVVFTRSGASAHLVAQCRPSAPIFAYTSEESTYRALALWWGVQPMLHAFTGGTDAMVEMVSADLRQKGLAGEGDLLVVVGSTPILVRGRTNFIKLHTVTKSRTPEVVSPNQERMPL